jgi:hypothetical protein
MDYATGTIFNFGNLSLEKKSKKNGETKMKRSLYTVLLFVFLLEQASAVQFEAKGKAIASVLGTKSAFQKKANINGKEETIFYSKASDGKAEILAFVQEGLYPPNCTHTWVIGVNAKTTAVTEVRPVEMSCPHAFPTKEVSFLNKFKGKAVAEKLDSEIKTIAKATGSSKLLIEAVQKSLTGAKEIKGQF